MKRIIDLINPDTINKTIVVAAGYKFEISDTLNDKILGVVYLEIIDIQLYGMLMDFRLKLKMLRNIITLD